MTLKMRITKRKFIIRKKKIKIKSKMSMREKHRKNLNYINKEQRKTLTFNYPIMSENPNPRMLIQKIRTLMTCLKDCGPQASTQPSPRRPPKLKHLKRFVGESKYQNNLIRQTLESKTLLLSFFTRDGNARARSPAVEKESKNSR